MTRRAADGLTPSQRRAQRIGRARLAADRSPQPRPAGDAQLPLPAAPKEPQP